MATDWAADVKKYAANADDAAIAGIVRYCGIALRNRDSAMVAFSDKTETDRVRTNFLQKKLALPHPQSELDAAIARVGAAMKGDRTKNRVTVYYLLAQEFDQLAMFVSKTAGKTASKAASTLPLAAVAVAPKKPAAKVVPKAAAKVSAAKPVSAVPAVKPAAKAAKAPAAAVGAAAAVAAAKPAKTAAAKPAATKPAAVKTAVVNAPAKAAAAKPAAKQAAVTTKKSAPTKAAVSTAAAAPAAKQGPMAGNTGAAAPAAAKTDAPAPAPASTGTIAAATALGGAAIAAAAGGVEVVKDAAAKVAGLATDTDSSTVVASGSAPASVAAPTAAAPAAPTPAARPAMAAQSAAASPDDNDSGLGWLYWVLGALVLLALLWFLFNRSPADETGVAAVPTEAAAVAVPPEMPASEAAAGDLAAAPAEGSGSVQIPAGAGVTSELRGGKPVVKVYFDTGKTDLAGAFAGAAGGLKSYLSTHSGTVLNVSGYSDPSGNAAANAELSKNRAKAVQTALVAAGIPEASAMLVKPSTSADASVPKEAARRVEVVVK